MAANHARSGDDGEYPPLCTATGATVDVEVKNATQTLCPCHLSASGGAPPGSAASLASAGAGPGTTRRRWRAFGANRAAHLRELDSQVEELEMQNQGLEP